MDHSMVGPHIFSTTIKILLPLSLLTYFFTQYGVEIISIQFLDVLTVCKRIFSSIFSVVINFAFIQYVFVTKEGGTIDGYSSKYDHPTSAK